MQIVCNLSTGEGPSNWLKRSRTLGLAIKAILDAQVAINRLYLSLHDVPPLYESGVRYENEPPWKFLGKVVEEFATIPVILSRGWDDCDGLAVWRCAELQQAGEHARIRIQWKQHRKANGSKGRKYFHIVVRRGNGDIEDPCAKLGMHDK